MEHTEQCSFYVIRRVATYRKSRKVSSRVPKKKKKKKKKKQEKGKTEQKKKRSAQFVKKDDPPENVEFMQRVIAEVRMQWCTSLRFRSLRR